MENIMYNHEFDLKSVNIGDSTVQYLLYECDGPPLVLLHATGFLPWLWHPIARELSRSFKVIAPYFCNHRESDPEKGGFSWGVLAEDLKSLCDCLDLTSPYMAGHSMGGAVISIACGQFGLDIKKLLLIEPIFLPQEVYSISMSVDQHPLAGKSINRRNFWQDSSEALSYLKSKQLFKTWDDEMLDLYVRYGMTSSDNGGLELTCHPRKEASLFMGSLGFNPWPVLGKVACPVLLLEGEHTGNKGFIDQKKAAGMFPNSEYRLVEGAGHLIPMEKPGEITRIMQDFFEE